MESPAVPYVAYRSKRPGRPSSNPQLANGLASPPPPARSRPTSLVTSSAPVVPNWRDAQAQLLTNGNGEALNSARVLSPERAQLKQRPSSDAGAIVLKPEIGPLSPTINVSPVNGSTGSTISSGGPSQEASPLVKPSNGMSNTSTPTSSSPTTPVSPLPPPIADIVEPFEPPVAGPSQAPPPKPAPSTRKSSTFRHVPLRSANTRSPLPSSPLRPGATSTTLHSRMPSWASQPEAPPPPQKDRVLHTIPSIDTLAQPAPIHPSPSVPVIPAVTPPPRSTSLPPPKPPAKTPSPGISPAPSHQPLPQTTPTTPVSYTPRPAVSASVRLSAPYRPGFQPKGVYRPRTDEFIELRAAKRDVGRIERTRLERRLEKLIQLHFPPASSKDKEKRIARKEGIMKEKGSPNPSPMPNRRASSFFDLDSIKGGAEELWKGVLQSQAQAAQGGKMDTRAAEQKITPWQDDSGVSACPLCSASFHPLMNRKHHCRLCGRVICSLPPKHPQRMQTCSLLFVVSEGRIEEVAEGVDYGVRKRGTGGGAEKEEAEKFLKGGVWMDCRQQQYQQEVGRVPTFAQLYEAFITLEKDIEDTLPQFQELLVSLSNDEQPTKEASAIRKHLLDSFAQYDALAKRIRTLPCAKGSSQERVQAAVLTRANLFLQRHMLPLQSISRPATKSNSSASTPVSETAPTPVIDPDSELAKQLQPLLEQEALLETYVEEATTHRKFEDAKTLKMNLREIRAEIQRMVVSAEGGGGPPRKKGSRG
ncbi:hypothetical protein NEOLEDRAFT_1175787 [Neolentinus lepideus HHB14362 ss-1]|uniref:FYVE-type domain-containing protein n=1 Tax=Neolentinus lepideus HHB14362 ss-1 TaxID=1314782 RepID=A0A165UNZ3_9AGAM|nr:hypothetical protein NEOLEDRAFT_1175787 [Neolentinus lepideus HHB14362 ss-1]